MLAKGCEAVIKQMISYPISPQHFYTVQLVYINHNPITNHNLLENPAANPYKSLPSRKTNKKS